MANINKKRIIKNKTGLPTKEQLLLSPQNTDRVPAQINSPQGQAPAALTEGEFVFAIPAIIGLGEGDYDQGLERITKIHDELKAYGEQLMGGGQGDPEHDLS